MSIDLVGLDLNALSNISAPVLDINQTANAILTQLPITANNSPGGYFAYIILATIFMVTYWYISDKSPLGDFRYSDIRALNISFGLTASIGLTLLSTGFIFSWVAVVFSLLSFLVTNIFLMFIENKQ